MSLSSEHQHSAMDDETIISPHNFRSVIYLNLAETRYDRNNDTFQALIEDSDENGLRANDPKEAFFRSCVKIMTYAELKSLVFSYPAESRRIEVFLWYIRVSNALFNTEIAVGVFMRLLQVLHMWHNDSDLVLNLLNTFCAIVPVKQLLLTSRVHPEFIRYVLRVSHRARFNIRQYLAENIGMNPVSVLPFCPVLESFLSGITSYLDVYITHGFDREEYSISLRNNMYMDYFKHVEVMNMFLPFQEFYTFRVRRRYLVLETFYMLYIFATTRSRRRSMDWVRSALLMFRSIPDSLICWREILSMLNEGEATENLIATIRTACDNHFYEIFSDDFEPRTLKHLSRCTIRTALRDNFQLPNGIRKLKLPEYIGSYLRLRL